MFACIPKAGYVGVGEVIGAAQIADDIALRDPDGGVRPFRDIGLRGTYLHDNGEPEWVVPVRWTATTAESEAYWEKGMFANQNSACKLRSRYTLDRLTCRHRLKTDPLSPVEN